ncbi:MAG: hypothetical protein AAB360_01870 [Patescibacteria group bacterium]
MLIMPTGAMHAHITLGQDETVRIKFTDDNRPSLSIAVGRDGKISLNGEGLTPDNFSLTERTPLDWKETRDPVREIAGHSLVLLLEGKDEQVSARDLQTDLRYFATRVRQICTDVPSRILDHQRRRKIIEILCQLDKAFQQF